MLGECAYLPAGANRQVVEDNAVLSPLGGAESMEKGPRLVGLSGVKQIRLSPFPRYRLSWSKKVSTGTTFDSYVLLINCEDVASRECLLVPVFVSSSFTASDFDK